MVIPANGGDARDLLRTGSGQEEGLRGVEWTRDGRYLLFNRKGEVWRIPSQGGQAQSLGIASRTRSATISVHPDGRRIAFTDGELVPEVGDGELPATYEDRAVKALSNTQPRRGATT